MTQELPPTGPFLQAALICERILQEQDGVLSAIRIIDRLIHQIRAPTMPDTTPKVPYQFTILIVMKSGTARGRHQISIRSEDPKGQVKPVFSTTVLFEGEDRGNNLVVQTAAEFEIEGVYWYDVLVDDRLFTRMPFRLVYQLLSTGTA
jgi:uncharacterized protein DUF6941